MAKRRAFTREELVLCIFAARYDIADIGGIDTIHSLQGRSLASIKMKIQNIVAMCDEEGISRNSNQNSLTGLPAGETGRRTNWDLVAQYASVSRDQHLKECRAILQNTALLPDELPGSDRYVEGARRQISVNAYERDLAARKKCVEHYGASCVICGFNFADTYGLEAAGFIHVHHLTPLSEIGASYTVDPIKDLRPVCPNCHAIIHHRDGTRTISEVREMLDKLHKHQKH